MVYWPSLKKKPVLSRISISSRLGGGSGKSNIFAVVLEFRVDLGFCCIFYACCGFDCTLYFGVVGAVADAFP